MELIKRTIEEIAAGDLKNVEDSFGRHAGISMEKIPGRQEKLIRDTRDAAYRDFRIRAVYRSDIIAAREGGRISLAAGAVFESGVLAKVLEKSDQALAMVVSLQGFEEASASCGNVAEQFFLDSWATAMVSCAAAYLKEQIKALLTGGGLHMTASWSPGQHDFSLDNQREIFTFLEPEDIDVTLKDSLLMVPQKSESAVLGICREEPEEMIVPCDFCDKRESCPSAYENIDRE